MIIPRKVGVKVPAKIYEDDAEKTCTKRDCIYRSCADSTKWKNGKCNYMWITGHSRIAKLPEGEARWPSRCPFYQSKKAKRKGDDGDMKWISVGEDIPKPGKQVLGIGTRGGYCIAKIPLHEPYFVNVSNNRRCNLTHWMELPERPEVDE